MLQPLVILLFFSEWGNCNCWFCLLVLCGYICTMQRTRTIIAYFLIVLVLTFSAKADCLVFPEGSAAHQEQSNSSFSEYSRLSSLYVHSTDNTAHAPLAVKHLKSAALLKNVVLLLPTQQFHSTRSVARNLLLQLKRVAYVIYPFHDFLWVICCSVCPFKRFKHYC